MFRENKIIRRLNQMIDNAIEGNEIENKIDETKMSVLESKLANFLETNNTSKIQLENEKVKINQLVSDISHQTKTPLSNILLYTQLLEEGNLSDYERNAVEALKLQTEKLSFLISSLIKISRLETGIITLNPILYDISIILENVVKQIELKIIEKDIKLSLNIEKIQVLLDPKWTTEAIYNIIDNAVKYTDKGGLISISITVYKMFCKIDVTDNGIGIKEDEINKIFSRFYRSQLNNNEEGIGIGLYLYRQIISDGGGYIKVKSNINEGSTFSIYLPMK